jgi:hypothetical protein
MQKSYSVYKGTSKIGAFSVFFIIRQIKIRDINYAEARKLNI